MYMQVVELRSMGPLFVPISYPFKFAYNAGSKAINTHKQSFKRNAHTFSFVPFPNSRN